MFDVGFLKSERIWRDEREMDMWRTGPDRQWAVMMHVIYCPYNYSWFTNYRIKDISNPPNEGLKHSTPHGDLDSACISSGAMR